MPATLSALEERARDIAGLTLGQIAAREGFPIPASQRRFKGWAGQMVERALGATSASRAGPDFPDLGVEVKTVPLNARGVPSESTFVCVAAVDGRAETWPDSAVRRKLACVLWVPVEADPAIALADRRIGSSTLWRPSLQDDLELRADWEELTTMIALGQLDLVSARHGRWLQLRPKAASARALTPGIGPEGTPTRTLPRGFYLRTAFTARILRAAMATT